MLPHAGRGAKRNERGRLGAPPACAVPQQAETCRSIIMSCAGVAYRIGRGSYLVALGPNISHLDANQLQKDQKLYLGPGENTTCRALHKLGAKPGTAGQSAPKGSLRPGECMVVCISPTSRNVGRHLRPQPLCGHVFDYFFLYNYSLLYEVAPRTTTIFGGMLPSRPLLISSPKHNRRLQQYGRIGT